LPPCLIALMKKKKTNELDTLENNPIWRLLTLIMSKLSDSSGTWLDYCCLFWSFYVRFLKQSFLLFSEWLQEWMSSRLSTHSVLLPLLKFKSEQTY
jgi:hypothetical protein